jgi:hypothetical protein
MTSAIGSVVLAVSVASTGGLFSSRGQQAPHLHHHHHHQAPGGRIVAPGPGDGWGFPNGNPDGYGWVDYGTALPLGGDRTPDYFFPRYLSSMPQQIFFPQYYNPYVQRGQRYIPWAGCGGAHPFGGPPTASSVTPMYPDREAVSREPVVPVPDFSGATEAAPLPGGPSTIMP